MATRIDTALSLFDVHRRLDGANDLLQNYRSLVPFLSPPPQEEVLNRIRLSHSSAREFLLREIQVQIATASIPITLAALAYVKSIKETPEETLEDFPLAHRAVSMMFEFASSALSTSLQAAGYDDIIRLLLQHGADINAGYNESYAPLQAASRFGRLNTVKILLEHEANAEADNKLSDNPLVLASRNGYVEVVKLLLDSGVQMEGDASPGNNATQYRFTRLRDGTG
ncbi:hypothetical protein CSUB01_03207 [Colletotrichum sublineola]|uniref:Uncharacterized protein n=1 Tax=Colletotrichum sublineola TaxID=1173701 RepID=A0A066X7W2_COLSU|nr:hypothetical protein CSUB01_03207 [Colletotrichum sublineola]